MARTRKKAPEAAGGAPMWMVTYGDLMSLLLTFFVLLLSFSAIVEEDFQKALAAIRAEILFLDFESQKPSIVPPVIQAYESGASRMRSAAERIRDAAAAVALDQQVTAVEETEGLRITIEAPVLFGSGQATLREEASVILRPILDEIIAMPNPIVVEGHTDNVPIRTARFPTNWELSAARAIAVARFFIDVGGMQPKRVAVAGYGEYQPIASNETAEGRAKNRRVELFVYKAKERER
ncbi:MAG: flagellar motor protein MotB [Dehalococcoidia bacterium]